MFVEIGRVHSTVIAAGGVAAVFGLYWDDAWHTDVGRDTFFSRPHLLLYAGVSVLLAAVASWAWRRYRVEGRAILRDPALVLPLSGAVVTLLAAPVDEAWHQLFARDAVTWSPPHMVAVAGMAAFAAGLFLVATRPRAGSSRLVAAVIGAFVIAAVVTVVMEFETDVPQFPVVLYLPVKVAVLTLAFGLIRRASGRSWAATQAAAVYVVLRITVVAFLSVLGHSVPTVMPTVVAALGFDVAMRRGWGRWAVAAATALTTVGSHVPAHRLQPAGLSVTGQDLAVGLLIGAAVSAGVLAAVGLAGPTRPDRPQRTVRSAAAVLLVLLVMAPAGPAFAHDPGQGEEVAEVTLEAFRQGDRIDLRVSAPDGHCDGWAPVRLLARRAGRTRHGPLEGVGGCRFAGTVQADEPGRWFVYAELSVAGRLTEAWLPVEDGSYVKDTALYVAAGEGAHLPQVIAGVLLYVLVVLHFAAILVAYRRAGRPSAGDEGHVGAVQRDRSAV